METTDVFVENRLSDSIRTDNLDIDFFYILEFFYRSVIQLWTIKLVYKFFSGILEFFDISVCSVVNIEIKSQ